MSPVQWITSKRDVHMRLWRFVNTKTPYWRCLPFFDYRHVEFLGYATMWLPVGLRIFRTFRSAGTTSRSHDDAVKNRTPPVSGLTWARWRKSWAFPSISVKGFISCWKFSFEDRFLTLCCAWLLITFNSNSILRNFSSMVISFFISQGRNIQNPVINYSKYIYCENKIWKMHKKCRK